MKLKIIILFLLLFEFSSLRSQEGNNSINNKNASNLIREDSKLSLSFGVTFSHFNPTKRDEDLSYKSGLANLGFESLINYNLINNLTLSSGLSYQFGKTISYGGRKVFHEISLPLLASITLSNSTYSNIYLSTGVYVGKYIGIKYETRGSKLVADMEWHEFPFKYIEGYSPENFICDLYLGLGYNKINNKNGVFQFNAFVKYRVNEQWLNLYVSKLVFGIKVNYVLKI